MPRGRRGQRKEQQKEKEKVLNMHDALDLHELLGDELVQRRQSGFEVSTALANRVLAVAADRGTPVSEVEELYDDFESAPLRPNWEYQEPTKLDQIQVQAPGASSEESPRRR